MLWLIPIALGVGLAAEGCKPKEKQMRCVKWRAVEMSGGKPFFFCDEYVEVKKTSRHEERKLERELNGTSIWGHPKL